MVQNPPKPPIHFIFESIWKINSDFLDGTHSNSVKTCLGSARYRNLIGLSHFLRFCHPKNWKNSMCAKRKQQFRLWSSTTDCTGHSVANSRSTNATSKYTGIRILGDAVNGSTKHTTCGGRRVGGFRGEGGGAGPYWSKSKSKSKSRTVPEELSKETWVLRIFLFRRIQKTYGLHQGSQSLGQAYPKKSREKDWTCGHR